MMPQEKFIPFHRPSIGEDEISEVVATIRSGWLTTGSKTAAFEKAFAAYVNAHYAQAVNSCTAGLHLALAAMGIGPGDEVVTTPMTFCATVNTILQVGATPVLADIGPDGNLEVDSIAERISSRTRAILPVHLAGMPCDMKRIWQLAAKHDLKVIEDAAHAIGTRHLGAPIGSSVNPSGRTSDAVAFSFYATKNLTTGEGGMVTTPFNDVAERMKILCLHGIDRDAWNRYAKDGNWYYEVVDCGFKYNLSDIQSAIGIHQLRRQEEFIDVRTRYAEAYNAVFSECDEIDVPDPCREGDRSCWHLYILRLKLEKLTISRTEFVEELKRRGINTSVHFIPISLHPYYSRYPTLSRSYCPSAIKLYERIVSLPLYPDMSIEEVHYVASNVAEIARRFRTKVVPVGVGS